MDFETILFITLIALLFAFPWLTQPTQADIEACMQATNYTAERCEWEMTR